MTVRPEAAGAARRPAAGAAPGEVAAAERAGGGVDVARAEADLLLRALDDATGSATLADGGMDFGGSSASPQAVGGSPASPQAVGGSAATSEIARWAASGAMALTGRADGPPAAPSAPVASRLTGAAAVLRHLTRGRVDVDGPGLLGERAALRGLTRNGTTSAGGATRLLPSADGWLAVSLPRPDDVNLVPAWLDGAEASWESVAAAAGTCDGAELAERGQELGLAVAVVPPSDAAPDDQLLHRPHAPALPWLVTPAHGPTAPSRPRVLDLSALWAGPLCADLLGRSGADVVTTDSVGRPDGARHGDPGLFSLLHGGTTSVPVDLRTPDGRRELRRLIDRADIVISAARPRALQQLDLWPVDEVARRPGLTWVAITGYGLTGPWCNRVAYGDDAAAAGGLVVREEPPMFCADAAADPATGLYAAIAALACAATGGGVVDVSLREVAAHVAMPPYVAPPVVHRVGAAWVVDTESGRVPVAPPRARRP
jgi:hypothetical protein